MDKFSYINNANGAFIEDLYLKFKNDPNSVDEKWQKFFEGYEFGANNNEVLTGHELSYNENLDLDATSSHGLLEARTVKLINAYRERGHLISKTNPVRERRMHVADLSLDYYNIDESELDTELEVAKEIGLKKTSLRNILAHLEKTYCGSIGIEFRQIRNLEIRQWLYSSMEPSANNPNYSKDKKIHILNKINEAVIFENFLHTKFVGQKRFSLEGLEALIPAIDAVIQEGVHLDVKEIVIGMAHRGRLNMLVNIFGKNYENVFSEFSGTKLPDEVFGDGDVKYHLGRSADVKTKDGKSIHLSLTPNPSHLEAVNPVVLGIVKAKAEKLYNDNYKKIVPILIHGDAAISGQGIVYECANLSELDGYKTGGTIHIVLNNQVGFTANYFETRSSIYCTDIAKVLEAPVFHVNADDPEAVVHAMEMAIKLRQEFAIDVFVDILGYRRYGHNEGDEPKFTQPILYDSIKKHENVFKVYINKLINTGIIESNYGDKLVSSFKSRLQDNLDSVKENRKDVEVNYLKRNWSGFRVASDKDFESSIPTGFNKNELDKIASQLIKVPKDFNLFSKMKRLLDHRKKLYFEDNIVDWGLAELLAFGSLLLEGFGVRLSGQDSQRGTFSHRHSVIRDEKNENVHIPLLKLQKGQGYFEAYNSHLSEYGVLGFEFGYSLAAPKTLTIWEAQFGDFANGAQIIFDQFISTSESKWQRMSGLMVFLPHGFEGQGPEHSSARIERYLQLCGDSNMYVVNPTTPANFFHLIRRQMKNNFRKPAIVMTPKSGLRHPKVISSIKELEVGKFKEVLDDPDAKAASTVRLLLCSGKVYFDLLEKKEELKITNIAIVRVEQLFPLPEKQILAIVKKYKNVKEIMWVQEEPENMGAYGFLLRCLQSLKFSYVGRRASSSPATGSSLSHTESQKELIDKALTL